MLVPAALRRRLERVFYNHGLVCASHPVPVIMIVMGVVVFCTFPLVHRLLYGHSDPAPHQWRGSLSLQGSVSQQDFHEHFGLAPALTLGHVHFDRPDLGASPALYDASYDSPDLLKAVLVDSLRLYSFINSFRPLIGGQTVHYSDVCLRKRFQLSTPSDDAIAKCVLFSPTFLWQNDLSRLQADPDVSLTIGRSASSLDRDIVYGSISLQNDWSVDHIDSLFLLLVFRAPLPSNATDSALLSEYVDRLFAEIDPNRYSINAGNEPLSSPHSPNTTHIFFPTTSSTPLRSDIGFLVAIYVIVALYISFSVGKFHMVRSKYGLGFTAVFTVFCSMLSSVGICTFFGTTSTLMAVEIIPFLVIAIGVDNIFVLTNGVVATSIDLPVRERIAHGLSHVGVRITMGLLTHLTVFVVGSLTSIDALREFCLFATIGVLADFFLQCTFFATVLSIDIRRLELNDLHLRKPMMGDRIQSQTDLAGMIKSYANGPATDSDSDNSVRSNGSESTNGTDDATATGRGMADSVVRRRDGPRLTVWHGDVVDLDENPDVSVIRSICLDPLIAKTVIVLVCMGAAVAFGVYQQMAVEAQQQQNGGVHGASSEPSYSMWRLLHSHLRVDMYSRFVDVLPTAHSAVGLTTTLTIDGGGGEVATENNQRTRSSNDSQPRSQQQQQQRHQTDTLRASEPAAAPSSLSSHLPSAPLLSHLRPATTLSSSHRPLVRPSNVNATWSHYVYDVAQRLTTYNPVLTVIVLAILVVCLVIALAAASTAGSVTPGGMIFDGDGTLAVDTACPPWTDADSVFEMIPLAPAAHTMDIECLSVDVDSSGDMAGRTFAATASLDRTVALWELYGSDSNVSDGCEVGAPLVSFLGHSHESIWSLKMIGGALAVGTSDGTLCVWQMEQLLQGVLDCPWQMKRAHVGGGITCIESSAVYADYFEVQRQAVLPVELATVKRVEAARETGIFVTGGVDGAINLWWCDAASCEYEHATMARHRQAVTVLALDGARLACSGSQDGSVNVIDVVQQRCTLTLYGHASNVTALCTNNGQVVSGDAEGLVRVCSTRTGALVHVLKGHTDTVLCVQAGTHVIATSSIDGSVRLWHRRSGRPLHHFAAFSPSLHLLGSSNGSNSSNSSSSSSSTHNATKSLSPPSNDSTLVCTSTSHTLVYNTRSGRLLHSFPHRSPSGELLPPPSSLKPIPSQQASLAGTIGARLAVMQCHSARNGVVHHHRD